MTDKPRKGSRGFIYGLAMGAIFFGPIGFAGEFMFCRSSSPRTDSIKHSCQNYRKALSVGVFLNGIYRGRTHSIGVRARS